MVNRTEGNQRDREPVKTTVAPVQQSLRAQSKLKPQTALAVKRGKFVIPPSGQNRYPWKPLIGTDPLLPKDAVRLKTTAARLKPGTAPPPKSRKRLTKGLI